MSFGFGLGVTLKAYWAMSRLQAVEWCRQPSCVLPVGLGGWLMKKGTGGDRWMGLSEDQGFAGMLCYLLFDTNISGEPQTSPQKCVEGTVIEKQHLMLCVTIWCR